MRRRPLLVWSHVSVRLLVVVLLTVITVVGGASAYELLAAWRQDARGLESNAHRILDRLRSNLEYPLWQLARDAAEQIALHEMTSPDVRAVVVLDEHGEVYVGLVKGEDGAVRAYRPDLPADRALLAASYRAVSGDVYQRSTRIGTATLYLTDERLRAEWRQRAVQITLRLLLFAATLAVAIFVSLRSIIVKPISRLEAWVKAAADVSDPPPPPAGSAHEIASLARAFVEMSARVRQARAELERRVEARTAELRGANLALSAENAENLRAVREIERLNADLQRHAAELATANARLEEVDRLKSEFLATMSHELRTPLNSIIGFTGILRQGMAGPMNDEQTKQLGMVHASARHLLSLINDLLDVSRMEAGKIDLSREPFDFVEVVGDVLESLRPVAAQKQLVLRADLASTATELVGDRKRCFQVLLNLANNAVKFTERGEVCITVRVERGRLRVAVADTGIGIKPEHLGKLFEAFRQVDGSARRVYEGTGLGLYLCRKLLALMGGEIAVESEHQKGSRFTFSIPLRSPAPDGVDARPAHDPARPAGPP